MKTFKNFSVYLLIPCIILIPGCSPLTNNKNNDFKMYDEETYNDKETYSEETYNEETYNEEIYSEETYNEEIYREEAYNEETHNEEIYNEEIYNNEKEKHNEKQQDNKIENIVKGQKATEQYIKGSKEIQTAEFIEYENKKYNFKITIPNNRRFQEDNQGFDIILKTPKNDNINENLGVKVQELQTEESLESFTQKTIEGLNDLYENYVENKKENIETNGTKGISLVYEMTENGYNLMAKQTVFLKDNKSYIFQYTATKDTFNNYINEINKIINSFTILD